MTSYFQDTEKEVEKLQNKLELEIETHEEKLRQLKLTRIWTQEQVEALVLSNRLIFSGLFGVGGFILGLFVMKYFI